MVDEDRAEKKLVAVLVDKSTTSREGATEYRRTERSLRKLRHDNPTRYASLFSNFLSAIAAFDKEMTRREQEDIDKFEASFRRPRSS